MMRLRGSKLAKLCYITYERSLILNRETNRGFHIRIDMLIQNLKY